MSSKMGVFCSLKMLLVCHVVFSQNTGSIKDSIQKEVAPLKAKIMAEIQGQVSSLDTSVKHVSDGMKKLESQRGTLKKTVNEQQQLVDKLATDFNSMEVMLLSHGNMLEELKYSVYPDDKTFLFSNETCGGVLQAQSGYVVYTSTGQQKRFSSPNSFVRTNSSSWLAATCVWTLQANHRSIIKFTSHIMDLPFGASSGGHYSGVYVLEGLADAPSFTAVKTKIQRSVTYTFKGPLLYVVLFFPENISISSLNSFSFQFQYESKGNRVHGNTFFSHRNLNTLSSQDLGNFTENDLEGPQIDSDLTASRQFTSIIFSNFTTRLRLRSEWGKCENTSVMVFPLANLFLGNSSGNSSTPVGNGFTNLCKTGSPQQLTKLFTSYGTPLIVLINKPRESAFPFNLSWVVEPEYKSSYTTTDYGSVCGETLSGNSGIISFKQYGYYRNGRRCVWAIVPRSAPYTSIDIEFSQVNSVSQAHNRKESQNYDYVYVIEFTTVGGLERPGGPKITKLNNSTNTFYKATSREVFVVFYSDYSGTNPGFFVNWRTSGDVVQTGSDMTTQFSYLSQYKGAIVLDTDNSPFFQTLTQVFMFIPNLPFTFRTTPNYVFGMDFYLDQANFTTAVGNASLENNRTTCFQENFLVLASSEGHLRQAHMECLDTGRAVVKNADGFVMVISRNASAFDIGNRHKLAMNFTWKQAYPEGDSSLVRLENDKCGGVIVGYKGFLRYKLDYKYNRNEHCIWLLQSPTSSNFSLKLLKNGFASDDRLVVNTIDIELGTLRDDAVQLGNSSSKQATFNNPLLVISFRPSATSVNGTGFLLQFWSSFPDSGTLGTETVSATVTQNDTDTEQVDFRLRYFENHSGRFYYDGMNQSSAAAGKQLHVLCFSYNSYINTGYRPAPVNVSWAFGLFKKDTGDCIYDTLRFYSTIQPEEGASNGNLEAGQNSSAPALWKQTAQFPEQNQTTSCPSQILVSSRQNLFTANYTAFLVIYKLVSSPVEESSRDERKIDFSHTKIVPQSSTLQSRVAETDSDEDYFTSSIPDWSSRTPSQRELYRSLLRRYRVHLTHGSTSRNYFRG